MTKPRGDSAKRRSGGAFNLRLDVPGDLVREVLAIDPGAARTSKTNGYSHWIRDNGTDQFVQVAVGSTGVLEAIMMLSEWARRNRGQGVAVVEEFRLYPHLLADQGLTQVATAQVIGAMQWELHRLDWPVPMIMQGAHIKKAAQRAMDEAAIEAQGTNQHARDAEMHGWYWILKKWRH